MSQENLYTYVLRLGDNSLILGQRLAELTYTGPTLEESIALTNISLDLFGQANHFLELAAKIKGEGDADSLAFRRHEREYFNSLLAEQPNGDFAHTIIRQFLLDAYTFHLYTALTKSSNENIAALAAKSLKEVSYHIKHSSSWVVRLGDGTEESNKRMQTAIDDLWRFTDDIFQADAVDNEMLSVGVAPDLNEIKKLWLSTVNEVFNKAKLTHPEEEYMVFGSREGVHTEYLGHLIAEMQYLQRAMPDATW